MRYSFDWTSILPVLLLIFCTPLCSTDAVEDVITMISKFETISASTADVLAHMQKLTHQSMAFLKLAFPIGSLIAGALHIATNKPYSDEYRALLKLNESMTREFDRLGNDIKFAKVEIALQQRLVDYMNFVEVPFQSLKQQMRLFWDPSIDKSPKMVEHFADICYNQRGKTNPLEILNYLFIHTVKYCEILSTAQLEEDARVSARSYRLLRLLGTQKVRQWRQDDELEADFIILLTNVDRFIFWNVMEKIEANFLQNETVSFMTMREAIGSITEYLALNYQVSPPSNDDRCLLEQIVQGKKFHHRPIEQMANMVRFDIAQLLLFGSACANISFAGNPSQMMWYEREINHLVVTIVQHLNEWIPKKLETSWPDVEIEAVKDAAEKIPSPTPELIPHLNLVAQNLSTTMRLVGNPRYYKQMLITSSARTPPDKYYTICPEKWCISIINFSSLNILLTRFILDEEARTYTADAWLIPLVGKIHAVINKKYNVNDLATLRDAIEAELHIKMVNDQYFRSFAIVRDYTGPQDVCGAIYGQSRFITEKLSGIDYVFYYWGGSLTRDCEYYALLFFL